MARITHSCCRWHQAGEASIVLESVERELVGRDGSKASERNIERVAVEECDTGQGEAEQDEFDGYAERQHVFILVTLQLAMITRQEDAAN